MKKSKFLATTLTLSLLSGLFVVSCGNTENPTSSMSTIVEEFATRIIVTSPEDDVMVGDTINLDDFVEVVGLADENNFKATLKSEDTATLDGHLLTVTAEGEIKVEIVAGANNKKASFQVESLSTLRAAFKAKTQYTTDYFAEELEINQNNQIVSTGHGIVHNSKYFAMPDWYVYDENGKPIVDENDKPVYKLSPSYSGMVKAGNGKTYAFEMDDLNGTNAEVLPGPQTDFQYYYLAMGNSLSYTDFETVYDDVGEPIGLTTTNPTAIQNYCMQTCSVYDPVSYGAKYGEVWTQEMSVMFIGETLETSQLAIMVVGYDQTETPYIFAFNLIHSENPELYTIDYLENYIKNNEEPTPLKCDELTAKVAAIAEAKNYTLTTEYFISENSAILAENPGPTGATLPEGTVTQVVTPTTVSTTVPVNETQSINTVYHVDNGQVKYADNYTYASDGKPVTDANGNPVVSDTYTTETITGSTSIWDDAILKGLTIASANVPSIYSNLEVTVSQATEYGVYNEFSLDAGSKAFAQAFLKSAAGYGRTLDTYFSQDLGEGECFYNYTYCQSLVSETALIIDMYTVYNQTSTGYIFYHIRSTYTNIGTTAQPDLTGIF